MKKKLLAVSVAGAFAVPGVALAQTTVTISGFFKGGFETLRYGQSAKNPASQSGVVDDSSRIIFGVREDLGGGLAAIAQLDIRFKPDDPSISPGPNPVAAQNVVNIGSGNTWFGVTSKDWGRLRIGRLDLHYIHRESELTVRGSLRADSISLLSHISGTAIAGATRTQNVINYTTPNWGGFTLDVSYSSNPGGYEADINSGARKGRAWNVNPNMAGKNWQVGYSYWSSKPDAPGAATVDQRADRLYGSYTWGGLKVGFAWDKSKLKASLAGTTNNNRTAWSLPVQYTWGPHGVYGHYTRARDDKATAAADGARMWALSYAYDFSKRTSVALTYARIRNDVGASYDFFTSAPLGLGGNAAAGGRLIVANEDPRTWGVTLRHAF